MATESDDFAAPTVVSPTTIWNLGVSERKPATLVGAVLGGRYRLLREIGPLPEGLAEGKAVTIFVGEHSELGHAVQIKVFRCADEKIGDMVTVARAQGQVALAEPLCCLPWVSKVIDLGLQFGVGPYLVFQAHGTDLPTALASADSPNIADVALVALQIARLLETTHSAGLVYGTVYPQNVFVDRTWRVQLGPPVAKPHEVTRLHDIRTLGKLLEAMVDSLAGKPSPESSRVDAMKRLAQALSAPSNRLELGQAVQQLLAICPEVAARRDAAHFSPVATRKRRVLRGTLVWTGVGGLAVIAFLLGAAVSRRGVGTALAPTVSPQHLSTAASPTSAPALSERPWANAPTPPPPVPMPLAVAGTKPSPEAASAGSGTPSATGVGEAAREERTATKVSAGTDTQKSPAPATTTAKTPTPVPPKATKQTGAVGDTPRKGNSATASRPTKSRARGFAPW